MVVLKHKTPDGQTAYLRGVTCVFDKAAAYHCSNRAGTFLLALLKRIHVIQKDYCEWELESYNES